MGESLRDSRTRVACRHAASAARPGIPAEHADEDDGMPHAPGHLGAVTRTTGATSRPQGPAGTTTRQRSGVSTRRSPFGRHAHGTRRKRQRPARSHANCRTGSGDGPGRSIEMIQAGKGPCFASFYNGRIRPAATCLGRPNHLLQSTFAESARPFLRIPRVSCQEAAEGKMDRESTVLHPRPASSASSGESFPLPAPVAGLLITAGHCLVPLPLVGVKDPSPKETHGSRKRLPFADLDLHGHDDASSRLTQRRTSLGARRVRSIRALADGPPARRRPKVSNQRRASAPFSSAMASGTTPGAHGGLGGWVPSNVLSPGRHDPGRTCRRRRRHATRPPKVTSHQCRVPTHGRTHIRTRQCRCWKTPASHHPEKLQIPSCPGEPRRGNMRYDVECPMTVIRFPASALRWLYS